MSSLFHSIDSILYLEDNCSFCYLPQIDQLSVKTFHWRFKPKKIRFRRIAQIFWKSEVTVLLGIGILKQVFRKVENFINNDRNSPQNRLILHEFNPIKIKEPFQTYFWTTFLNSLTTYYCSNVNELCVGQIKNFACILNLLIIDLYHFLLWWEVWQCLLINAIWWVTTWASQIPSYGTEIPTFGDKKTEGF